MSSGSILVRLGSRSGKVRARPESSTCSRVSADVCISKLHNTITDKVWNLFHINGKKSIRSLKTFKILQSLLLCSRGDFWYYSDTASNHPSPRLPTLPATWRRHHHWTITNTINQLTLLWPIACPVVPKSPLIPIMELMSRLGWIDVTTVVEWTLEKIFSTSFFDFIEHLFTVHLLWHLWNHN